MMTNQDVSYWRMVVKSFLKVISILVLGYSLVAAASASFVLPGSETYVGYIGNLDIGRLDGSGGGITDIGTDWISSPGEQDDTFISHNGLLDPAITSPVLTTHWYKFALNTPSQLMDFIELGSDASLEISFFNDDATYSDPAFETVARSAGHEYQLTSPSLFPSGIWWMKIAGTTTGFLHLNYKVRLSQAAVPLPPAILLFGSALAGFGVLGHKKRQRVST